MAATFLLDIYFMVAFSPPCLFVLFFWPFLEFVLTYFFGPRDHTNFGARGSDVSKAVSVSKNLMSPALQPKHSYTSALVVSEKFRYH